ncbi:acetolactate synthase large subunit [Desulfatitalea alkaliphila]|uniref:Acetolactate synthase large subunit n=1 Tax=Desulfatitalea alkaliphila TaxID=2929485 RepID=A0AA41ULT2_9BACT|nr:acetolactate synthase large subunit [Desulfatitalea alkaliphila]MCJ8501871.1 acetolactate synthase large subunit [Desulfatitalea alkaliphila]
MPKTVSAAESLMKVLADTGISVCFTNPGTTEIHLVAALETETRIKGVLCLFEGVCSGAADGFARMTGRPAATLLHLGPGLANAMANLHNARRARSPVVNLVGDHPAAHRRNDPPLASDIATLARPVSAWVSEATDAAGLPAECLAAVRAALSPPGQVATLIIPTDCAWGNAEAPAVDWQPPEIPPASDSTVATAAGMLRADVPTALMIGGKALQQEGLRHAARIAARTGATLLAPTFDARFQRGAGIPMVRRLPYFPERVQKRLAGFGQLILVGVPAPTAFFAYPDRSTDLLPPGCRVAALAAPEEDGTASLAALADALGAGGATPAEAPPLSRPELPEGPLSAETIGVAIGALLPEGAIVSDESGTSGEFAYRATGGTPPHDWLCLTGGSIGQGIPLATGAALACPDRPVICLQGDGGAMYTLQALWTQAREQLNITTVIFSNRKYQILEVELWRLGFKTPGARTTDLMRLGRPEPDWVQLSQGMGVPAVRVETTAAFITQFNKALAEPGPHLIEAVI